MNDEYFASLAARGINLDEAQKLWYIKKSEVLKDDIKKEYPSTPEEAFEINMSGLYYASHVAVARAQKRILNIPYDCTLKVHSVWDLGFTDSNSIVLFQVAGKEIHIIDFIEGTGISLKDYILKIKQKEYIYGTHLGPHDIKVHEYSTGISRLETAAKLGIHFTLVPDIGLTDGIDAVRNVFNRLYFNNNDSVLDFLRHIENYSQKWDRQLGLWSGRPEHNEHSHAADALRYLAVGLSYCLEDSQSMTPEQADTLWRQHGRRI